MRGRRLTMAFVGAIQEAMGASAIVFSYILHYNLFDVQIWLDIPTKHVFLYLLLLFVFGFVSIISGFFLLRELSE